MGLQNRVGIIPLSSIDSSTITGTYQTLTTGLPQACFLIVITNASNKLVEISYDGITDHEVVLSNQQLKISFQQNAAPKNWICKMAKGTPVYVKGAAGTGDVYLSGYFQYNVTGI